MSNLTDWVKHFRQMVAGGSSVKSGDVVEVRQYGGNVVPIKQVTRAAAGVTRVKVKVKNAKSEDKHAKTKKRVHKRKKKYTKKENSEKEDEKEHIRRVNDDNSRITVNEGWWDGHRSQSRVNRQSSN